MVYFLEIRIVCVLFHHCNDDVAATTTREDVAHSWWRNVESELKNVVTAMIEENTDGSDLEETDHGQQARK